MTTYSFNESHYQSAKDNFHRIAWNDFRFNSDDFPDFHCMPNPLLIKYSEVHVFWKTFFDKYFDTNSSHFHFILRLVNSYLITCAPNK